jgi:hypothetical protein
MGSGQAFELPCQTCCLSALTWVVLEINVVHNFCDSMERRVRSQGVARNTTTPRPDFTFRTPDMK